VKDAFEVVFVCTGNRFRSPIAAAVFASETAGKPVHVYSLGTLDLEGEPAFPEALRACSSFGLDLSSHRSRGLGGRSLRDADLVVGFERAHVARAVVDAGAPPEKSFLLDELVEGLEASEQPPVGNELARARAIVALAEGRVPEKRTSLGISDPVGGSDDEYERTAIRVRDLASKLGTLLFGGNPR
jgi:low molecular weight protein-tyrosine phosphatase